MNYCIHDDTYTAQHDTTKNVHLIKGRLFSDIDKVKLRIYNIMYLIMFQYNFLFIPLNMQSFEPKLFEQYCK